ncbi:unnamed protein product [Orchesella dallaii]|uniref:Uncharacterized protein n=1 Tax=Orchesella dallaii TaxID=48710 RepID=A0ABP1Q7F8_9HEXA
MSGEREKLLAIAAMQQFNGSFALNQQFCTCLGVALSSVEQAANTRRWNKDAFATVVALVYFLKKLTSLKDDWELIADKSKIWLLANYREFADDMFECAQTLVL